MSLSTVRSAWLLAADRRDAIDGPIERRDDTDPGSLRAGDKVGIREVEPVDLVDLDGPPEQIGVEPPTLESIKHGGHRRAPVAEGGVDLSDGDPHQGGGQQRQHVDPGLIEVVQVGPGCPGDADGHARCAGAQNAFRAGRLAPIATLAP